MSTLRKEAVYDPNIPIITPGGGIPASYNDPRSPESLMKRTKELEVQGIVDTKYDSTVNPHEQASKKDRSEAFVPFGEVTSPIFSTSFGEVKDQDSQPTFGEVKNEESLITKVLIFLSIFFIGIAVIYRFGKNRKSISMILLSILITIILFTQISDPFLTNNKT